jgi:serine O-acetyltransferase
MAKKSLATVTARRNWSVFSEHELSSLLQCQFPEGYRQRAQVLAREVFAEMGHGDAIVLMHDNRGTLTGVLQFDSNLHGFFVPGPVSTDGNAGDNYRQLTELAQRLGIVRGVAAIQEELQTFQNGFGSAKPVLFALTNSATDRSEHLHRLNRCLQKLLRSYRDRSCELLESVSSVVPPQAAVVRRFVNRMMPLLFPGHFGKSPRDHDFEASLCRNVSIQQSRLTKLVRQAMVYDAAYRKHHRYPTVDLGEPGDKVISFFEQLADVRRALNRDFAFARSKDPALPEMRPGEFDHTQLILAYPGPWAVTVYRLAHVLFRLNIPYLPRMMTEYAHGKTGIDLHPAAQIEPGFFIDHGTGVTVGATAIIKGDVVLYQGCTLGALNFPVSTDGTYNTKEKRHPTIGHGCTIYANAAVLGDITVGDYSTIGSNVSVRVNVPRESTVRMPHTLREMRITTKYPAVEMAETVHSVLANSGTISVDEDNARPDPFAGFDRVSLPAIDFGKCLPREVQESYDEDPQAILR